MEVPKDKFFKLDPKMRMFILMHEFAHEEYKKMPQPPPVDHEAENKKYFENFPFDEQVVRDFLQCYFKDVDMQTVKLSDILCYPNYRYGFKITNVTVGKGIHKGGYIMGEDFEVNEDEVYVTHDDMYGLAGGVYTTVMQRKDGVNKIIKQYCHARS